MLQEEGSQSEEKAAAQCPALVFQRQRVNGTAIIFNYLGWAEVTLYNRIRDRNLSAPPCISVHN